MNKYLEILQMFVSQDDLRPAITVPNKGEFFTSATDAHSIVYFKNELLPIDITFEDKGVKYPNVLQFVNQDDNINVLLSIEKINSVLSKCPLIEDFDEEEKEVTCDECNGSGEVIFTYEDSEYQDHELDGECPICNGDGKRVQNIQKPNGKMVKNDDYFLNIDESKFSIFLIERLLKVAEILNGEIVIVNRTQSNKPITFKVGEVKVMIMPIISDYDDSEYCLGNIA